jgi:Ca-activated chloride channel homolog
LIGKLPRLASHQGRQAVFIAVNHFSPIREKLPALLLAFAMSIGCFAQEPAPQDPVPPPQQAPAAPAIAETPAPPQNTPAGPPADFTISANVDLVMLHLTVKDRDGGFASGLEKENFQVLEDGRNQTITVFRRADVPVTLGLVVDHSSSVIPKRAMVNDAAVRLVEASNPQDEVFIVHFNEKPRLSLDPVPFTASIPQLRAALNTPMPTGRTALYDGIAQAVDQVKKGKMGKRVLVVLSDGGDNSSTYKLEEVLHLAQRASVIIYTVGLFDETDPDRNPKVLKRIAEETGGEYFRPRELSQLKDICEHIATDVRNQYVLGFCPATSDKDDVWREVKVVANAPGRRLKVRTRAGFFAMKHQHNEAATQ